MHVCSSSTNYIHNTSEYKWIDMLVIYITRIVKIKKEVGIDYIHKK